MSRNLYDLLGLVSSVAFILALKGLSSPKSARHDMPPVRDWQLL